MSSLITAVFKATIGLLVNKGRDKLAEKLNEGDVTDQKIGALIVREIDEIRSKLDGLARTPLKTSISLFKEGIELLYDVFESATRSSEHRAMAAAATASVEQFDIAKEMRKLDLSALDEPSTRKLTKAKKRFEEARLAATNAFNSEALELPDRLLAMQYRLMATILETIDNPEDCLRPCKVCIEELQDVSGVKECFKVELKKRFWARLDKDERRKIISTVCFCNRVVYDVTLMARGFGAKGLLSVNWPCVNIGEEPVNPLRNQRVAEVLNKQGMVHCSCVLWSFGQQGEEEHKLKYSCGIASNHRGQFLIADDGNKTVKVFDSNGKFDFRFKPQTDDADTELDIWDVATAGEDDKIYLLVELRKPGAKIWESEVQVFNKTADLQHKFPVRSANWGRLTVSSGKQRGKILLLTRDLLTGDDVVHVYEPRGEFVCSFGGGVFKNATDITATCDGLVMIVHPDDDSLYIFDVEGHQLGKFNIKYESDVYYRIACHPASDHVVLAGCERETGRPTLAIYTVNGEFTRRIQLHEEVYYYTVNGITVTVEGHIAVALGYVGIPKGKVIVV